DRHPGRHSFHVRVVGTRRLLGRRQGFRHGCVQPFGPALREQKTLAQVLLSTDFEGKPLEAAMLLMCLPFVIYTASMQMFLDSLNLAPGRAPAARFADDR